MRKARMWGMLALLTAQAHIGAGRVASAEISSDLIARAKQEGRVVWYAAPGHRTVVFKAMTAWQAQYPGIEIEILDMSGPNSMERVRSERRAGRPVADLMTVGDTAAFVFAAEGGFQSVNPSDLPNAATISPRLKALVDDQLRYAPINLQAYGLLVNTSLLSEAERPQRLVDLLEPRFKRRLALHDPSRIGGGAGWSAMARPVMGDDFFKKLVAQDPRIFSAAQEMDAAVGRGERAVGVPGRPGAINEHPGAPLAFVIPEEGVNFAAIDAGIVANAPHPAATTLWVNFLLGPEVQHAYAQADYISVRSDIKDNKYVDLDTVKFLGKGIETAVSPAEMKKRLDFGAQLVGR